MDLPVGIFVGKGLREASALRHTCGREPGFKLRVCLLDESRLEGRRDRRGVDGADSLFELFAARADLLVALARSRTLFIRQLCRSVPAEVDIDRTEITQPE